MPADKSIARVQRHRRVRKKVSGHAARPRLSVYRSLKHLYAQLIDDDDGKTLFGLSSQSKEFSRKSAAHVKGAREFGLLFAKLARQKKFEVATFDRGGNPYHGRVKAFAEGTREGGLKF
ncbi:MAG: 50S ribosomal protein L18 [Deltaproteobacteria bacterium]|nr:50S ribosomal protein L18 [Deltaproteobacteria bacterium]MBI4374189.1 50S ribosomal protein L18 [Deltaproteobacteria bacterium]